tara:strand:+ start:8542 stop:8871 length:330 start_codon:yes stop_codon:yes gene_type:complete
MAITKEEIRQILREELDRVQEASMTKGFQKAIEAYQTIQLKQQQLRKAFVSEKNPKKKEKLKQELIRMHKVVQKADSEFQRVLRDEPVDLGEDIQFYKEHKTNKIKRIK